MRAHEYFQAGNATGVIGNLAGNASFNFYGQNGGDLTGGLYQATYVTGGGNGAINVQQVGPDGNTSITVITSGNLTGAASGLAQAKVPPGVATVQITGNITGAYVTVTRIPEE